MIDLNTLTPTTRREREELATERRVYAEIAERYGFLTTEHVAALATMERTRLTLLLVRCGAFRFLAPANQIQPILDIIERDGTTYVRDVSLPATGGR